MRSLKIYRFPEATVVDHITPHRGDKKLFWDEGNLQVFVRDAMIARL